MDVVIFRENTEDVYAGIEWESGTPAAKKLLDFLNNDMLRGTKKQIRADSAVGIKPMSPFGTKRLVRCAIQHALDHDRHIVTIVHKGNIQKFTEGAFRDWGYQLARDEFRSHIVTERESWILENKDRNPAISVEQNAALIEPGFDSATPEFQKQICAEVKATLDAIGASHGRDQWKTKILINDRFGVFEATHGTAPKYADKDVINPSSVMLSGAMMFDFLGWPEAARLIEAGIARTIQQKRVTYDLERLMPGSTKLRTSEFAAAIIANMAAGASAA
jgi:isocitrate dehydrogenase